MLRWSLIGVAAVGFMSGVVSIQPSVHADAHASLAPGVVAANDNREPAGELRDGVLTIRLIAGRGTWFPEENEGPGRDALAFGVEGREPSIPGPLLRVAVGTEIRASIRNTLDVELVVHGLGDRPGTPEPLRIAAGATRDVHFRVTSPGSYFYWGTTRGARTLEDRTGSEAQLAGVLVVDAPGTKPDDQVFVITMETDSAPAIPQRPLHAAVVNGRSWPHTRRMSARVGDTVRVRWINLSDRLHPIHLHGFYFRVDSKGDIAQDTIYAADARRRAVTEVVEPGQSISLTWVPERAGNWLMHCHMTAHMSPELRHGPGAGPRHDANHSLERMAGLVIGWRVTGTDLATLSPAPASAPRRLRLLVQSAPRRWAGEPGLGFVLQQGLAEPKRDSVPLPGTPIVLERGERVQITVVNRLAEPTSIHWHGIELDSYFDGVSGWSGDSARTAPRIEPGDSFVVQFTPPRAGTFIYHTHFEEERQLMSGMYGALIVLEPGAKWDPRVDRLWIIGADGPIKRPAALLNGSAAPDLDMEPGTPYRIRLINIHPNVPFVVSLTADGVPLSWRTLAKDGADLPPTQMRMQPTVQLIGVGETYDFELVPEVVRELALELRVARGPVLLRAPVRIRAPGS